MQSQSSGRSIPAAPLRGSPEPPRRVPLARRVRVALRMRGIPVSSVGLRIAQISAEFKD